MQPYVRLKPHVATRNVLKRVALFERASARFAYQQRVSTRPKGKTMWKAAARTRKHVVNHNGRAAGRHDMLVPSRSYRLAITCLQGRGTYGYTGFGRCSC